uniref:Uncharacterized protein n=1 Tax=Chaetoceros debilis TaxID=122233 RepID=A0A7S3Q0W5_9STRA
MKSGPLSSALFLVSFCLAILGASLGLANASSSSAILDASLGSATSSSSSNPKCHVPTLSKNLNYLDYQENPACVPTLSKNLNYLDYQENPAWLQDMIAAKCSDESILEVQAERMVLLKKAMKSFGRN